MHKDVIYIDVEDDITAIISKVKDSKEKIIALVPPKRIGVLQSAVNLRLLHRAASQKDKRLVLITNNSALMSLAASAKLPVAKNLQSKPELAEISAIQIDDDDDIIDGRDLPVGDHAKQSPDNGTIDDMSVAVAGLTDANLAEAPKPGEKAKKAKSKKGPKVPNFNSFRKKIVLAAVAVALLIGFLIWAIVIAPHATVVVSAKTNNSSVNSEVTVSESLPTDVKSGTIKAVVAKEDTPKSITFSATGQKNIGETAKGEVKLSKLSQQDTTIPAGSELTSSSGSVFKTDETVVIPQSQACFPSFCAESVTVAVSAAEKGAKYNAASGSLSGAPDGASAKFTGPTSGGTDKTVPVVTKGDVQKAKDKLKEESTDSIKKKLAGSFEGSVKLLDQSFSASYDDVKPSPGVDGEASGGTATMSGTVTYKIFAVEESQIDDYLKQFLEKQLSSTKDQRIYETGAKSATFQDVTDSEGGVKATLLANAAIGPKLEEQKIKDIAKGSKFGDIQSKVQSIQGVQDVDVKFFPFWISTVPDNDSKISVQFKVDDSN